VWIEALDIRGFKRLRGGFRFDKGLTVVVGPNESGKSSLHEALIRALFGFSRDERRKKEGRSEKDRSAPWEGGDFGLNALVHDVKTRTPSATCDGRGRSLRIEWDFRGHTVRLLDAATGSDLSNEVRGRLDEVGLGWHLLGLELEEFRGVCCLDQSAIDAVKRTEDLVLALQQAVESGSRDTGVEDAVEILNAFLKNDLGVQSLHLHALPKGALAGLQKELQNCEQDLRASEAVRLEIAELAGELVRRDAEIQQLALRAVALDREALRAERDELAERLARARKLDARSRDVPERPRTLPERTVSEIRARLGALALLAEPIQALSKQAEASRERVEALELGVGELTRALDGLEPYAAVNPVAEAHVRELRGRRAELLLEHSRIEPVRVPERDAALAHYRSERELLIQLRLGGPSWKWNAVGLLAATAIAAGSVGLGLFVHWAFFAGVLVAAGLFLAARRKIREDAARDPLRVALERYGASSLAELDARVTDEEARMTSAYTIAQERNARGASLARAAGDLEVELRNTLDGVGWPTMRDLDEGIGSYLTACERHAERLRLLAQLESLKREIVTLRQPGRDLAEKRREQRELEETLAGLFRAIGVDPEDLQRARLHFETFLGEARADAEKMAQAREASAALGALLGSRTIEELSSELENAERRLSEHTARWKSVAGASSVSPTSFSPGPVPLPAGSSTSSGTEPSPVSTVHHGSREQITAERERVRERKQNVELRATELRTQIREREEDLPDSAMLRERVVELEQRIRRLERAREAVRIAREALREAAREVHREFAPHLNDALARNLPRVTAGRYREAVVDDELGIKVEAPETGCLVPVSELSRGTQDQIYLIERLEIVRLLDPTTGEAPLLLDDPFARFDGERLRLALHVLRDVAAERQVVLFSEDPALVKEAEEICRHCAVIRLKAPLARARERDVLQMALSWDV
jgi:hypothetical protein